MKIRLDVLSQPWLPTDVTYPNRAHVIEISYDTDDLGYRAPGLRGAAQVTVVRLRSCVVIARVPHRNRPMTPGGGVVTHQVRAISARA